MLDELQRQDILSQVIISLENTADYLDSLGLLLLLLLVFVVVLRDHVFQLFGIERGCFP